MPDGKTLEQFEPLARCKKTGGPVYGWRNPGVVVFMLNGIKGGHLEHPALSSIGGIQPN